MAEHVGKGVYRIVNGCKELMIFVLSYCKGHYIGSFYGTVKH